VPVFLTWVVLAEVRPLAVPVRAPLDAVLVPADPVRALPAAVLAGPEPGPELEPDPERGAVRVAEVLAVEVLAVRAAVPVLAVLAAAGAVAAAAPVGTMAQFLNMKNCWPSVHTFVVTQ
jgi:hypothetical protein